MNRIIAAIGIFLSGIFLPGSAQTLDFRFDFTISRPVLENYLHRSWTFTELLHDDFRAARNARGVDPKDNIRLLVSSGAKLVGRALMLWGGENNLATFLARARPYVDTLHQLDPDIILQAAVFEYVSSNVGSVAIPARVFTEFGQPVVTRNFVQANIVYTDGQPRGGITGVPDMSRLEARMWFFFLATCYIDIGIEGLHFGQVGLMDQHDPGHVFWLEILGKIRAYARQHARRHMVICDAHTSPGRSGGKGGYAEGGKLLFDVHAFPLRIAPVGTTCCTGELRVGYSDALFRKSLGGITPSGWSCASLPYIVEFDNFGSRNPGTATFDPYIWGWDEITWFAQMPEAERNNWLRYAFKWIHDSDAVGHLEMPGSRVMTGYPGGMNWFWPNTKNAACPNGFNTEATVRELWGTATTSIQPRRRSVLRILPLGLDALQGFSVDGRWHAPLKF